MAAIFLRQFAEALAFMHANGVVHADLKPENLMLSSWDDEKAELKLVDFGCSVIVNKTPDRGPLTPSTIAYDPPEKLIHRSPPNFASDVWAAGCILYIVLTGTHPFDKTGDSSDAEIEKRVKSIGKSPERMSEVVFDERTKGLSKSVLSLLWYMLHPDPSKRTTSERFRRSRWVQGLTASWELLDGSNKKLENYWQKEFRSKLLQKYQKTLDFKGGIATDDQLRMIFTHLDRNHDGKIDEGELAEELESIGLSKADVHHVYNAINLGQEKGVSFEGFIAALKHELPSKDIEYYKMKFKTIIAREILSRKHTQTESLHAAARRLFVSMDLDDSGTLDCHELRMLLRSLGVNEKEISMLIASVDNDRDGDLTFEEFASAVGSTEATSRA